ncbi:MAG: Gfo/Idh/MocA family oxidoreductase [Verrucomicrobiales bacterium]|nr:Gfo/Idh/MocA family oxidoreductase [Verrucomicrobiales bacterium]
MQQVQWGMIGCGDVTEVKSAPAFNRIPGSRLVAVMARTPERVRDYAARHGVPRWYVDVDALLADPEVNAVYIATPPSTHAEYTLKAAAAGKPVYVEKPMARTHAECRRMIDACAAAGVPLHVAYYRRAQARFLKVKQLLDEGRIGAVRLVSVSLRVAPREEERDPQRRPWRVEPDIAGGGYFHDMASHQLDLLDFLFGPIRQATGRAANQAGWYPAADVVTARFELPGGVVGTGDWCFTVGSAARLDRVEITGSEGLIRFPTFALDPVEWHSAAGIERYDLAPAQPVAQGLIAQVVAALQGQGVCASTGESAARTSRVMDLICADGSAA